MRQFFLATLTLILAGCASLAQDRSALWRIVHEQCEPHYLTQGQPDPCVSVDVSDGEDNGYAILKDRVGATQFLLIPTRRISGVESAEARSPSAPHWFADAWAARRFLFERLGHELPASAIVLAINAADARSQDQMHIHVDCLRTDLRDQMSSLSMSATAEWSAEPQQVAGANYWLRRITGKTLMETNPLMLAASLASSNEQLQRLTLAVVGDDAAVDAQGFLLLAGFGNVPNGRAGHSEDLQDHRCEIGH